MKTQQIDDDSELLAEEMNKTLGARYVDATFVRKQRALYRALLEGDKERLSEKRRSNRLPSPPLTMRSLLAPTMQPVKWLINLRDIYVIRRGWSALLPKPAPTPKNNSRLGR